MQMLGIWDGMEEGVFEETKGIVAQGRLIMNPRQREDQRGPEVFQVLQQYPILTGKDPRQKDQLRIRQLEQMLIKLRRDQNRLMAIAREKVEHNMRLQQTEICGGMDHNKETGNTGPRSARVKGNKTAVKRKPRETIGGAARTTIQQESGEAATQENQNRKTDVAPKKGRGNNVWHPRPQLNSC